MADWGKMNVFQMAKHCTIWNDWVLGNQNFIYKQEFLGKIFGKMALKSNTKDDQPLSKSMPAGKAFTVKEKEGDLKSLLFRWEEQIKSYALFSNDYFIHDFFGKMTMEQIGVFAFKHNDHHLRQFNV
jgi:hypothetical protein